MNWQQFDGLKVIYKYYNSRDKKTNKLTKPDKHLLAKDVKYVLTKTFMKQLKKVKKK